MLSPKTLISQHLDAFQLRNGPDTRKPGPHQVRRRKPSVPGSRTLLATLKVVLRIIVHRTLIVDMRATLDTGPLDSLFKPRPGSEKQSEPKHYFSSGPCCNPFFRSPYKNPILMIKVPLAVGRHTSWSSFREGSFCPLRLKRGCSISAGLEGLGILGSGLIYVGWM